MRHWSIRCTFFASVLITSPLASGGVVLEQSPDATGANRVLIVAQGSESQLVDLVTGRVAEIPSLEDAVTSNGGVLRWRVDRDFTDHLGFRHIHYKFPTPFIMAGSTASLYFRSPILRILTHLNSRRASM